MSIYESASMPGTERLKAEVTLACTKEKESGPRRFSMLAYTGAAVDRMFGKAVFDLSGIEMPPSGRVPILLNHDDNQIVGYADGLTMTERGLELSGVISEHTEEGRKVAALADEGFFWQASVGLQVSEWEKHEDMVALNGTEFEGPIMVGRKTRLLESSFVPAGADKNTEAVALTVVTPTPEEVEMTTETPAEDTSVDPIHEELAATREALEALKAEIATLKAEREIVAQLEAETRHPGVGFVSPADTPAPTKPQNLADLWQADADLRAEFAHNVNAFAAWADRCPDEAASLLETE